MFDLRDGRMLKRFQFLHYAQGAIAQHVTNKKRNQTARGAYEIQRKTPPPVRPKKLKNYLEIMFKVCYQGYLPPLAVGRGCLIACSPSLTKKQFPQKIISNRSRFHYVINKKCNHRYDIGSGVCVEMNAAWFFDHDHNQSCPVVVVVDFMGFCRLAVSQHTPQQHTKYKRCYGVDELTVG